MNERTRATALKALDGMASIVKNEMLKPGRYVGDNIVNPELAEKGALCGGRNVCAIGSLWLGGGVKMRLDRWGAVLPGAEEYERERFLRARHGLRTAYNALNDAAAAWAKRTGARRDASYSAPIEALFEASADNDSPVLGRSELLTIINAAKRRVRAA